MPCTHNQACLRWLQEIGMWEKRCPCGFVAYGVTVADAFRVFRKKVPGLRSGAARPRCLPGPVCNNFGDG